MYMKPKFSQSADLPQLPLSWSWLRVASLNTVLVCVALFANNAQMGLCIASSAQPGPPFWSGTSKGFKIVWNKANLLVTEGSTPIFSAREFAKEGLAHFVAVGKNPKTGMMPDCTYVRHFRLLAVVGTLISFSDQYYASCPKEAHPGGETRFTTIDLSGRGRVAYTGPDAFGEVQPKQGGKAIRLTDLFSEQDIYAKLKSAPEITRLLAQDGTPPAPQNLAELLSVINGKMGENPDCFSVPGDLLSRFAIRHINASDMTIELGLPGAGPCRDELTSIPLQLPISDSLKAKLGRSENSQIPFINAAGWQEGKRETAFHLRTY
jgi:hypothetical protein